MVVTAAGSKEIAAEAKTFLEMYNRTYQRLYTVASEAQWAALTDVTDEHTGQRMGADKAQAAFVGSPWIIEQARTLMQHSNQLDQLTVRQLGRVLSTPPAHRARFPTW